MPAPATLSLVQTATHWARPPRSLSNRRASATQPFGTPGPRCALPGRRLHV